MEITLQNDGKFLVKFNEEEWESLKEVQDLMNDCQEKFSKPINLEQTLVQVIESGFVWLDS